MRRRSYITASSYFTSSSAFAAVGGKVGLRGRRRQGWAWLEKEKVGTWVRSNCPVSIVQEVHGREGRSPAVHEQVERLTWRHECWRRNFLLASCMLHGHGQKYPQSKPGRNLTSDVRLPQTIEIEKRGIVSDRRPREGTPGKRKRTQRENTEVIDERRAIPHRSGSECARASRGPRLGPTRARGSLRHLSGSASSRRRGSRDRAHDRAGQGRAGSGRRGPALARLFRVNDVRASAAA